MRTHCKRWTLAGLVVTAVVAVVAGCGGGSGGSAPGAVDFEATLAAAHASMGQALEDGDLSSADRAALRTAERNFRLAARARSGNSNAHTGVAMVILAGIAVDLRDLVGDVELPGLPLSRGRNVKPNLRAKAIATPKTSTSPWSKHPYGLLLQVVDITNLRDVLGGDALQVLASDDNAGLRRALQAARNKTARLKAARTKTANTKTARASVLGVSDDDLEETLLRSIMPRLIEAADHLYVANRDPQARFEIFPGAALYVGDLGVLEGVLRSTVVVISMLTAYDFSLDVLEDWEPNLEQAGSDGVISPAEYLPPAPFATLRADGRQKMAQSYQQLILALHALHLGVQNKLSETPKDDALIPLDATTRSLLQSISSPLRQITSSLGRAVTLPIGDTTVQVNLQALARNPVADLREILPSLNAISLEPIPAPNRTWNGLFPSGAPSELDDTLAEALILIYTFALG